MAVGDPINYIITANSGTYYYYQPAAGVEILITMCGGTSGNIQYSWYDGTKLVWFYNTTGTQEQVLKCWITNSIYLSIRHSTGGVENVGFSGLQTK